MTVQDNTKAARVFFPEGQFMPRVAYAPDDGTGQGDEADAPKNDNDTPVDPNKDIDDPASRMYPDMDGDKPKDGADGKPADPDAEVSDSDNPSDDDVDDDGKDGDDGDDDDKGAIDLTTVPEDGKYKLTMPDGIEVDQGMLDKLSPIWREKGFTHEEAQAMTDMYIGQRTDEVERAAETQAEQVTSWEAEVAADKDIGGSNLDATLTSAKSALTRFGTPELTAVLESSGLGSNPEVIRLLANVGSQLKDDDIPTPNGGNERAEPNTDEARAERLYGATTPSKRG